MKQPSDLVITIFDAALLRTASLLVPSLLREEWCREWFAELWHVRHSYVSIDDTFSWESQRESHRLLSRSFPLISAMLRCSQPAKGTSLRLCHIHGFAGHTLFVVIRRTGTLLCYLAPSAGSAGRKRSRALPDQI